MTEEQKARQDQYDAWIDELDAQSRQWEASQRAEYEAERDNFKGQLAAWKDGAEAQWDEWEAKVSQQWNGLKEKWHSDSKE